MGAQLQYQVPMPTGVATIDEFMQASQDLLKNVVLNWSYLLFPAHHRANIDAAWQTIDFVGAQGETDSADLAEVGLSGAQLDLKMSAVTEAFEDLAKAPSIKKLLKVFDWMLAIFGSLAGVSKRVEQIKEFIEVLQKLIDSQ